MPLVNDASARALLDGAITHATDAAQRHQRVYLIWIRERTLRPMHGLDRRGDESSLHQVDLTIFVRPSPLIPPRKVDSVPGARMGNPKDAYIYARIKPNGTVQYLQDSDGGPTDV